MGEIMMTDREKELLQFIGKQLVVRKEELWRRFKDNYDGTDLVLQKLKEKGFVASVEPIGSTCFTITQRGMRVLDTNKFC